MTASFNRLDVLREERRRTPLALTDRIPQREYQVSIRFERSAASKASRNAFEEVRNESKWLTEKELEDGKRR
jgi:hypothetical protein